MVQVSQTPEKVAVSGLLGTYSVYDSSARFKPYMINPPERKLQHQRRHVSLDDLRKCGLPQYVALVPQAVRGARSGTPGPPRALLGRSLADTGQLQAVHTCAGVEVWGGK